MVVALVLHELSFRKQVGKIGCAYYFQSLELVLFCRIRRSSAIYDIDQHNALGCVVTAAEEALDSAVLAKQDMTPEADKAYEIAREQVRGYCLKYGELDEVANLMKEAMDKDEKVFKKRLRLMKRVNEQTDVGDPTCHDTILVHLHVGRKPLTNNEQWIPGKISSNLSLSAVLWMLKQKNLITLSENPYFYHDLPEDTHIYDSEFRREPLHFGKALSSLPGKKEHVLFILIDRTHHILIKRSGGHGYRIFGNGWKPHEDFILKDITGKLETAKAVNPTVSNQDLQLYSGTSVLQESKTPHILETLIEIALSIPDRVCIEPKRQDTIEYTTADQLALSEIAMVKTKQSNIQNSSTISTIDKQVQSRPSTDKTNSINSESSVLPVFTKKLQSKTSVGKINPPDQKITHKISGVATTIKTNDNQTTINTPDVNISRNGSSTVNDEDSVKDNTPLDSKEPPSKKKGWFRRLVNYITPGKKS